MKNSVAQNFNYFHNFWNNRRSKLRYNTFKRVTKNALPLFLKGQDIITAQPMANGVHEPALKALINYFAASGYSDFLIDIGANIGLSSCQSGKYFRCVHMFEPNPNILSILKINSKIMLRDINYHIHEYGLAAEDAQLELYVPYDNWGGAFIKSSENLYDENLLSAKDGYGQFNINNYEIVPVTVKSAQPALSALFNDLRNFGYRKGVIKIDIEGFERYVIESLLRALPNDFQVFIIFENWKSGLTLSELNCPDKIKISAYNLSQNSTTFRCLPRFVNSLVNFIRGGFETTLKPTTSNIASGTCILSIG